MTHTARSRRRHRFVTPIRIAMVATLGLLLGIGTEFAVPATAGASGGISVHAIGGAPALGAPRMTLNAPLVAMAATRNGTGYWLLGQDGGIFSYGSAAFYGSTGGIHLNQPVVGMAPTPSGKGYWLVAADGGIFSFGDASFHGSTGGMSIGTTVAGIVSTPSGHGYWIATANGHIYAFGDAHGMTGVPASSSIVGLQASPGGTGLWLVGSSGAVYATGSAPYLGGASGGATQAVGIARAATGYWVAMSPSGPPLPANSGSGRRIVYSNAQQRIWLVEANGQVSQSFLVSGKHGLPAVGTYHVFAKFALEPDGSLFLPWTLKFDPLPSGGVVNIHGIPLNRAMQPIEPDFLLGTPESHGCVRLSQVNAEFVYNWAPLGTTVVVLDVG
jgi:L,D-transpeptidase catalytic domain